MKSASLKLLGRAGAGLLLLSSMTGEAAIVKIDLVGALYHTAGPVAPSFALGQVVTATLRFDTSSPGLDWYPGGVLDPAFLYYPNAPTIGWVNVGKLRVTLDKARIFVSNDEHAAGRTMDRFIYEDVSPKSTKVLGYSASNIFFNWEDDTAHALSNRRLPATAAAIDQLGPPRMAIDFGGARDGSNRITAIFNTVSTSTVPEPTSWMMLLSGLLCVGVSLRSRRRNDPVSQLRIA